MPSSWYNNLGIGYLEGFYLPKFDLHIYPHFAPISHAPLIFNNQGGKNVPRC
jgi:hypothetical protein